MNNLRTTLIAAAAALALAAPARATTHPLITDPVGDGKPVHGCLQNAGAADGCLKGANDPAMDILSGDVSATPTTVTATLVVDELGPPPGDPLRDAYAAVIKVGAHTLELRGFRERATGAMSGRAAWVDTPTRVAYRIAGASATADPAAGSVTITVSFAAVNEVIASVGGDPIGQGTVVDVSFDTERWTGTSPDTVSLSNLYDTTDVYAGYRLGS
jgi:hypothetical protein